MFGIPAALHLTQPQSSLFSQVEVMRTSFPGTGNLGWRAGMVLGSLPPQG